VGSVSVYSPDSVSVNAGRGAGAVIMMSQTRRDTKDRRRGELDYDVNRRAETEIQGRARKLNVRGEKIGDGEDMLKARQERE
jgi:uncharacterized membrane protein